MALYSVQFEAISPMTKIPNSQTIFGTICHYYENLYGTKKLEELLKIQEQKPIFVVSSMFIKDTLPLPQDFMPKIKKIKDEKDISLLKESKKITYISKNIYQKEYKDNSNAFQTLYYENLKKQAYSIKNNILMYKEEINNIVSDFVKTQRTRTNTLEEEYYQDHVLYFNTKTQFEFYIEIFEFNYIEKFKQLFNIMQYVSFGGHKSIGYNMFNMINMQLVDDLKSKKPRLLLSIAIGDDTIDYEQSYYQIKQLNAKFNNATNTINRSSIMAFTEGSIIKTDKPYIGTIIKEKNNEKVTYQNVMGLLI